MSWWKFYQSTSRLNSACGQESENLLPAILKYQRTEYAKQIRKDYEAGKIKERRCNMREYTIRTDGLTNTLTSVQKDNYLVVGNFPKPPTDWFLLVALKVTNG